MFDPQATVEVLKEWGGFLRNHVPVERWPSPYLWSGVTVFAGVVLAFWGARLLRSLYVLVFMVAGAAVGLRLAGVGQFDRLIGLILGAGAAAMIAYLLFRWWVALTTGLIAVLVLVAAGAPRLNAEFTAFNDFRQGVGSGDWSISLRPHEDLALESWPQFQQYAAEFWRYLLDQRRAAFVKTTVGLGIVWLLGTAAGLLLPRLITVLGTSIVGVTLFAGGAAVLLSSRWPSAWGGVLENRNWFLAGLAVLFLAAISFQARHRRPAAPVAVPLPATA
jgi:hypothetical protein